LEEDKKVLSCHAIYRPCHVLVEANIQRGVKYIYKKEEDEEEECTSQTNNPNIKSRTSA
jgi:hypothetical protein